MQRERTAGTWPCALTLLALLTMVAGLFATSAGAATAQCYPPPCGGGGGGGGGTTTTRAPGATTTTTAAPGATTTTTTVAGGGSTTTTVKGSTTTTTTTVVPGGAPSAGAPGTTSPPRGVLSRTGAALTKPLVALGLAVGLFGLLLVVLVRRAEAVRPR
jgi:hypothetical protein